ncbi:MAG: nuclear transport factor 2 family protein, partial [Bacteroidetes bacterium]|nr:nuclear transport factor 2 family protein [Bacteroidota bacterium]
MKRPAHVQKEILQLHEAYWNGYMKGDVKGMGALLDEGYTQVGSAETEVFSNKKDAVQFLRDTIDQVAGKLEMRKRHTRVETQG